MGTIAGNRKANHNSLLMEAEAERRYSIKVSTSALVDSATHEVKSCQQWVTDRHAGLKRRRGRFWFFKKQHSEVKKRGAKYILLVHENGNVVQSRILSPKTLESLYPVQKYDVIGVSWPRLIPP